MAITNYKVKYLTDTGTENTVTIKANGKWHLAQRIVEEITDMKDDDTDNILRVTTD